MEIACYSDGNTLYMEAVSGKDIEEVIQSLEEASKILLKWFSDNLMKSNSDKYYLLVNISDRVNIEIENFNIYIIANVKKP